MKRAIKAEDILNDIEFELIQGAIRQDELGQGIQVVRKFHNDLRTELLASIQNESSRDIVTRQAQLNDMLITLLQEMGNELLSLRQQQRQLNGWVRRLPTPDEAADERGSNRLVEEGKSAVDIALGAQNGQPAWLSIPAVSLPAISPMAGMGHEQATDEGLTRSMRRDALALALDVRPVRTPLIGWILQKVRSLFHSLAFFYAQQLGERQAEINRIYGDRLLSLSRENAHYQRQVEDLAAEVERLRKQQAS